MFDGRYALVAGDSDAKVNTLLNAMLASTEFSQLQKFRAEMNAEDSDFWPGDDDDPWMSAIRPYTVVDGILQVPIRGVLLHDFPYQFFGWATGYKYLERAVIRGLEDANVKAIALVSNSPGGMVSGCFDAVDRITAARAGNPKPIRAYVSEEACSAAYAQTMYADEIIVSRTGLLGSIGVVTSHLDLSKMYEDIGVKVTYIFRGKHKVDGNSTQPLSKDAKARIENHIDELYEVFVNYVAEHRGLDAQAVRDTEAAVYSATESLEAGLADRIGPLEEELAAWAAALQLDGGINMSKPNTAAPAPEANTVTQSDLDAAVVTATAEATKAGATAERTRIAAILGHDEAKDRSASAQHLALSTDMSVEDAAKLLATLPKTEAVKPAAPVKADGKTLDTLMGKSPAPGLDGNEPPVDDEEKPDARKTASRILSSMGFGSSAKA